MHVYSSHWEGRPGITCTKTKGMSAMLLISLFLRDKRKSLVRYFSQLVLFYANIVVTFALVYTFLDLTELGPVVDHYQQTTLEEKGWLDRIGASLYFSVITLFSVGYGDVTPFGLSRAVAVIQAMFGYILPAVLVIQYMKTGEP